MKKLLFMLVVFSTTFSKEAEDPAIEAQQIKEGNFLLPVSQQIVPLISFGQRIINKGDLIVSEYIDYLKGYRRKINTINTTFNYGITNNLSVLITLPAVARMQDSDFNYSGFRTMDVQFEYAYYTKGSSTYTNQATVVANLMLVPTGPAHLPLGKYGNPGVFLGGTASHIDVLWHYFISAGALFRIRAPKNSKLGNVFVYEAGFSRNLGNPSGSILDLCIECNGFYVQHDKHNGRKDPNSGGNVITITPSLYFATQRTFIYAGLSIPIAQHLFGNQRKDHYYLAVAFGWTVN